MASVYEILTERFIKQLEKGTVPWHKPWYGCMERAYSASTGKPYKLINQLILNRGGFYYTHKQIKAMGLEAPSGKCVQVFMSFPIKKKKNETDEEFKKRQKRSPWTFSYYNVWHESDIPGFPEDKKHDQIPEMEFENSESADALIDSYISREGIRLEYVKGDSAYYSPVHDEVVLPLKEQFTSSEEFYSAAFHELAHSTGHRRRLNRIKDEVKFGDESYSKEELIAEISSACVMQIIGINTERTFENSAAYVQGWLSKLKNDSRLIVMAANQAEKAVEFIMGKNQDSEKE